MRRVLNKLLVVAPLCLVAVLPALAAEAEAEAPSPTYWSTDVSIDTLWVLMAGFLVFFMNAGFGCVEAASGGPGVVIGGPPARYDIAHSETENEVLINFVITGGTGKFLGATGSGVLQFVYDTMEPHNLLEAGIILNLD